MTTEQAQHDEALIAIATSAAEGARKLEKRQENKGKGKGKTKGPTGGCFECGGLHYKENCSRLNGQVRALGEAEPSSWNVQELTVLTAKAKKGVEISNAFEALATADECTDVRRVSEWDEILGELDSRLCEEIPKVPEAPTEDRAPRVLSTPKSP